MTRVKRGYVRRRRHKKIVRMASGHQSGRSRVFKQANESVMHALRYAYFHRREKKGDMRRLWNIRINAAARANGPFLQQAHPRPQARGRRCQPQDARRIGRHRTLRPSPQSPRPPRPNSLPSPPRANPSRRCSEADYSSLPNYARMSVRRRRRTNDSCPLDH